MNTMNTINFDDLPCNIKELIFEKNRKDTRDKILNEFWEEWEDIYIDDIQEAYCEGLIEVPYWEDMEIKDKVKFYKGHLRSMEIHYHIVSDASLPDWCYEAEAST